VPDSEANDALTARRIEAIDTELEASTGTLVSVARNFDQVMRIAAIDKQDLEEARAEHEARLAEMTKIQDRLQHLEAHIYTRARSSTAADRQVEQRNAIEEKHKEIDRLLGLLEAVAKDQDEIGEQTTKVESKLAAVSKEKDRLSAAVGKARKETADIMERVKAAEGRNDELAAEQQQVERNMAKLEAEVTAARSKKPPEPLGPEDQAAIEEGDRLAKLTEVLRKELGIKERRIRSLSSTRDPLQPLDNLRAALRRAATSVPQQSEEFRPFVRLIQECLVDVAETRREVADLVQGDPG